MSDILQKILATKRGEVAQARARVPMELLREQLADASPVRDFVGAIRAKHHAGRAAVIAEIKKQSPSAGQFRHDGDFDPAQFAAQYEAGGAACLSVLTDEHYFGGTLNDLRSARAACTLPVLRKDFIVDEYQIIEARVHGADAVLFIIDAMPIADFQRWQILCESLGLAVLIESHTAAQLAQSLTLRSPLIGINNRDLTRFVTDLNTTLNLLSAIPSDRVVVTESGIESPEAIATLMARGVQTYLVGGALMRAQNPGQALERLFATSA